MLILQRRPGESLRIGENIEISVLAIEGGRARLAITAPAEVTILRSELIQAQAANQDSVIEQNIPEELLHLFEENSTAEAAPLDHNAHPPVKPVAPASGFKQGDQRIHPSEKGGTPL